MTHPMWHPSAKRRASSNMEAFTRNAQETFDRNFKDYASLHRWSVENPEEFWPHLWDYLGIISSHRFDAPFTPAPDMKDVTWFPGARLNHAENILRRRDNAPALLYRSETGVARDVSFAELYNSVSRCTDALRSAGIGPGDRIAGILSNVPEAVIAMLAANSIGAIWSLCSPDFGAQGIIDRFSQINPKCLFVSERYVYKGKNHDISERVKEVVSELPSMELLVSVPCPGEQTGADTIADAILYEDFIAPFSPGEISFEQMPFNHPAFVLFTSGTTGPPKCILHSAGGFLLQLLKEHRLHYDLSPNDRYFYYTSTGWNMWYWLTTALAAESTVVLYDGSPLHPKPDVLFDLADAERITSFGIAPRVVDFIRKAKQEPIKTHNLGSIHTFTSSGSPLSPENFDYIYQSIKRDVCLISFSGGTEIMTAFATGNPAGSVWRGELQVPALGMDVRIFDETGVQLDRGKGELVCVSAFPSTPLEFLNDPGDVRYRETYFERFPGVWHHGDFAELTENNGMIIHGRSDTTLNPGGIRIGTGEIYRSLEPIEEIQDCLVTDQTWNDDTRIILFVRLRDGVDLNEVFRQSIKTKIRQNTTPHHVPAKIISVPDIPFTKTGKIAELAVKRIINGEPVLQTSSLANPDSLDHFTDLIELRT